MIRAAGPADLPAIARLWNHAIRETPVTFNATEKSLDEIRTMLDPEGRGQAFLVVEQEPRVTGFARSFQFRAGYARTLEHSIMLEAEARGRGSGRALMAEIEVRARSGDVHTLFAGVSSGNPDGKAFHAAIGFEEVATLAQVGWKFGRWWDLVLMQKRLA